MAGDWIPIEVDLSKQRKTIAIARRCKWSAFEVVGRLVDFWGWATSQPIVILADGETGALVDVTVDAVVDAGVAQRALLDAMVAVGWLSVVEIENQPALAIPRYNSWLSKVGKARMLKALRQRRWRQAKNGVDGDVDGDVDAVGGAGEYGSKKEEGRSKSKYSLPSLDMEGGVGETFGRPPPDECYPLPPPFDAPAVQAAFRDWFTWLLGKEPIIDRALAATNAARLYAGRDPIELVDAIRWAIAAQKTYIGSPRRQKPQPAPKDDLPRMF